MRQPVILPPEFIQALPALSDAALRLYVTLTARRTSGESTEVTDLAKVLRCSVRTVYRASAELQRLMLSPTGDVQSRRALTNRDTSGDAQVRDAASNDNKSRYDVAAPVTNAASATEPRQSPVTNLDTSSPSTATRTRLSQSVKASEPESDKQRPNDKQLTNAEGTDTDKRRQLSHAAPHTSDSVKDSSLPSAPPPAPPPGVNIKHQPGRVGVEGKGNPGSSEGPKPIPFVPKTEADLLALDIARAFHDETHLPTYQFFCEKYDLSLLRRALSETMQTPLSRIRTSRFALFQYLVRKHSYENRNPNQA
jgi:hypothetical protein